MSASKAIGKVITYYIAHSYTTACSDTLQVTERGKNDYVISKTTTRGLAECWLVHYFPEATAEGN